MKSQDIIVILQIALLQETKWSYKLLSQKTFISPMQCHRSIRRLDDVHLFNMQFNKINYPNLIEFLIHGFKYNFPGKIEGKALGVPTAYSSPIFSNHIVSNESIVWPSKEGQKEGAALEPIHEVVPKIALSNPKMYDMLSLLDALRIGRIREIEYANIKIKEMLNNA